ncbi:uncharacterized protein LOC128554573 [Mercenaria mercenaria]|uniref:uncharacterized protein LOC128554573 n=1 Tax=Mercenaria mercenaria TaxID=6596 RepID=UPI00234EA4BB|nr:uncharacterized protein LOC128554573 [Mercenaria mercenaria]
MLFCVCCSFYPFKCLWRCLQWIWTYVGKQPRKKWDAFLFDYDRFHCVSSYNEDKKLRNKLNTEFNLEVLDKDKEKDKYLPEKTIVVTCKAKTRGAEDLFSALENFQDEELDRVIFIYLVSEESQTLSTYVLENGGRYERVKEIFNYIVGKEKFRLHVPFHDALQDVFEKKETEYKRLLQEKKRYMDF